MGTEGERNLKRIPVFFLNNIPFFFLSSASFLLLFFVFCSLHHKIFVHMQWSSGSLSTCLGKDKL